MNETRERRVGRPRGARDDEDEGASRARERHGEAAVVRPKAEGLRAVIFFSDP